ncbi:hypothetical protein E4T50_10776 [Aureobasidium sp. EXF-12298]|nr:hypothetical protein E4T50_10776 [Aureobasidium sp. EXF-12298]KAI4756289.1 hypothetical protein E4T51_10618 [Aureobasidium sp. EXF-12344]KAI4773408.1 hypothetical protein E4T52_11604 [Aureobasidium sp. EXF-3400]
MANDYVEYLSANVSYRTLSRALRVHANRAKQMLYDFHQTQNKKTPNSLHATYLITGIQSLSPPQPEDHVLDQSSPAHQEPTSYQATSLLLVDQDNLDTAKSTFDQLLSIHVYSVQPGKINDLHVLTECNRAILAAALDEDLLDTYKQCGIIQNSQAKRRPMRAQHHQKQPPAQNAAPSNLDTKPAKSMFASTKSAAKPPSKNTTTSAKSTPDSSQASTQTSAKPATTKAVPLKREGSSLFKAFAKAKPKTQSQVTESSAEPSPGVDPVANEDDAMNGLSDEEADDEDTAMLDDGAITETGGKSKKEREDELRRMMDMEDEPMADAPIQTPTAEASEAAEDEPDSKPETQTKQEPEETVTVTDGRRRGRRRVMKKKTVQDEEGYLVTREEAAWESFSEEEPAPKKAKVSVAPPAAKTKKAAPKGQGNIMSFFSKK